MPEAVPACSSLTESITVVVRGATVIAMPKPSTSTAGRKLVQKLRLTPGNANSAKPAAAIAGPTTSGKRAPIRLIRPPDQRESENIMTTNGNNPAPAAVALRSEEHTSELQSRRV